MRLQTYKPYWRLMRFDKPIGIYLLLWPTLWGLWASAKGMPSWLTLFTFVMGTIFMRAAGCVVNDIADRNFDQHVERTKERPLTSGQVSLRGAIVLFIFLSLAAFSLVLLFLNSFAIVLSFVGMILAAVYPFTKRFIYSPQFILGLAFSWGIPMAYAATIKQLPSDCWALYFIAILWPVAYDTMYAMVDREDDLAIGLKSTAIWFGRYDRLIIAILQSVIWLGLLIFGLWQSYHFGYFVMLVVAGIFFVYQQKLIFHRERSACFKAFLNNHWFGFLVFVGFVLAF